MKGARRRLSWVTSAYLSCLNRNPSWSSPVFAKKPGLRLPKPPSWRGISSREAHLGIWALYHFNIIFSFFFFGYQQHSIIIGVLANSWLLYRRLSGWRYIRKESRRGRK